MLGSILRREGPMTAKPQHTPGPWEVEGESGNPGEAEVIIGNGRTICWTADTLKTENEIEAYGATDSYTTNEDRANARLIAAAPELAEALKHLEECNIPGTPQPDLGNLPLGVVLAAIKGRAALQKAGLL